MAVSYGISLLDEKNKLNTFVTYFPQKPFGQFRTGVQ